MEENRIWNQVLPQCVGNFSWGRSLTLGSSANDWKKPLAVVLKKLDESEFKVFLAQLVIAASGKGVVGPELTEAIRSLREWRTEVE
jgi:hypothetical protein